MTLGIDVGSLFKVFVHEISCFFDIEFCIDCLKLFGPKINAKTGKGKEQENHQKSCFSEE